MEICLIYYKVEKIQPNIFTNPRMSLKKFNFLVIQFVFVLVTNLKVDLRSPTYLNCYQCSQYISYDLVSFIIYFFINRPKYTIEPISSTNHHVNYSFIQGYFNNERLHREGLSVIPHVSLPYLFTSIQERNR